MGTSNWQNISYCIDILKKINPTSVLDVGVGFGRWGIICREFLDVWTGKVFREDWRVIVHGIEGFKDNIDEYHKYFYDEIIFGDALEKIDDTPLQKYDLAILGDVLEHFNKNEGIQFLKKCLQKSKFVLIAIPLGKNWPQTDLYGNKFEAHRSVWRLGDFSNFKILKKRKFLDSIQRKFGVFLLSEVENKLPQEGLRNLLRAIRNYLKYSVKDNLPSFKN